MQLLGRSAGKAVIKMGKSTSPEILIAELYRKVQECQPTRLNLIAAAIAGTVNDFGC